MTIQYHPTLTLAPISALPLDYPTLRAVNDALWSDLAQSKRESADSRNLRRLNAAQWVQCCQLTQGEAIRHTLPLNITAALLELECVTTAYCREVWN